MTTETTETNEDNFEMLFDIFEDRVISGAVLIAEMQHIQEIGEHYNEIAKHPLLFQIADDKISSVVTDMGYFVEYCRFYSKMCENPDFLSSHRHTLSRLRIDDSIELIMKDLLRRKHYCDNVKVIMEFEEIMLGIRDFSASLFELKQNTRDYIIWCYENDDFFYTDDMGYNWNIFMFKKYVKPILKKRHSE